MLSVSFGYGFDKCDNLKHFRLSVCYRIVYVIIAYIIPPSTGLHNTALEYNILSIYGFETFLYCQKQDVNVD